MVRKPVSLLLALLLAVLVATHAPARVGDAEGDHRSGPPPNASARVYSNMGACVKFISVYVPSQGGQYVVGISLAYRDVNGDGRYTPGVDRMQACINCADACGYGP
jgi:hypothetical protein